MSHIHSTYFLFSSIAISGQIKKQEFLETKKSEALEKFEHLRPEGGAIQVKTFRSSRTNRESWIERCSGEIQISTD